MYVLSVISKNILNRCNGPIEEPDEISLLVKEGYWIIL